MRLSHWLYKLKPIISTSEMIRHLECGRDFEVNQNCKKVPCSLANGPQRIRKEETAGHRMLQCIGYTSVVQCEGTVVLRSVEMRIFGCGMQSGAICGTFCTWFSTNYPLTTFHILYSAKYPHPALTSCGFIGERLANVCHHINHCIARHLKLDSVYTSGTGHIILVTPHLVPEV